jgi:steroid delta-isomerase-like uncharacterized protein
MQDIKSTVRRFYEEVLNQGHVQVMDEILAPTFVDHTPSKGVSGDRANLRQQIDAWRRAFPDLKVHVDEAIAEGDALAVRMSWQGTHKAEYLGAPATGKRVQTSAVDILHVREGRITEAWHYGADAVLAQLRAR